MCKTGYIQYFGLVKVFYNSIIVIELIAYPNT